jgi:uncharacterized protein (TIGR03085 family)
MTVTSDERAALSDLFDALGPDAPTLLEGWLTGDLLAHLLVRERRPDAAGGILVPFLAARTERVMAEIRRSTSFPDMVKTFRAGPPKWSPWAIPVIGDRGNTVEFYVHHEDVRRAQPDWEPRPDNPEIEDALWRVLKVMGKVLYRKGLGAASRQPRDRGRAVARPEGDGQGPLPQVAGPRRPAERRS